MGAVMSHLAARVYAVLKQQRPYQVRDHDGKPMSRIVAGRLIRERFRVPDEVRSLRRHRNRPTKKHIREEALIAAMGRRENAMTYEAANAPQQGSSIPARPNYEDNTMQEVLQPISLNT
jgi:hypothetical protein